MAIRYRKAAPQDRQISRSQGNTSSTTTPLTPGVMRAIGAEAYRAWRALRRFAFEATDVSQEITLHWIRRHRQHDPRRASAETFIARIGRNRCHQLAEAAATRKRGSEVAIVSLSDPVTTGSDATPVERSSTISVDDYEMRTGRRTRPSSELVLLRLAVRRVLDTLSPDLVVVATRLSEGTPVKEIAEEMGIARSVVYRRIVQLREVFAAAGFGPAGWENA